MEAFSFAWERIKADPGTILGTMILGALFSSVASFVGGLCASIYQAAAGVRPHSGRMSLDPIVVAIQATSYLLSLPLEAFFMAGMTIFAIHVARGETYSMSDLFSGGRHFVSMLVSLVLFGLLVAVGMGCLVLPGVILLLGWYFFIPAIVDKGLGPIEALKESWRITTGKKGDILLLVLGMAGVCIAGLCACCVGLLIAIPVCQIAQAYAYLRLTGQRTVGPYPAAS
jgi:uncharacterized membrane protein